MTPKRKPDWKEELYTCAVLHKEKGSVEDLVRAWREFTFLGTYKDAQEQSRKCHQMLAGQYEKARQEAKEAGDILAAVKAENALKGFAAFADADIVLRELEEKKQRLGARRRLMHKWLPVAAAALIVIITAGAGVLGISGIRTREARKWEQAAQYEQQENYEGALDLYQSLISGINGEKADEAAHQVREKLGYQYIDRGRYEEAIQLFTQENLEEGVKAAHTAWGEALLTEGAYESASGQFELAGDKEGMQRAGLRWSETLMVQEKYRETVDVLTMIRKNVSEAEKQEAQNGSADDAAIHGDEEVTETEASGIAVTDAADPAGSGTGSVTGETEIQGDGTATETIPAGSEQLDQQICQKRAEAAIMTIRTAAAKGDEAEDDAANGDAAMDGAANGDEANDDTVNDGAAKDDAAHADLRTVAASVGEQLDDLQGQLDYCQCLMELGIDPAVVYPEGVIVTDISLSDISMRKAPEEALPLDAQAPEGKYLIFRRSTSAVNPRDYITSFSPFAADAFKNRSGMTEEIRLLAGEWASLPEHLRAKSLEECSHVLMANTDWIRDGFVTIETVGKVPSGSKTYDTTLTWYYPLFSAADSVGVFEKDTARLCQVFAFSVSRPEKFQGDMRAPYPGTIEDESFYPSHLEQYWAHVDEAVLEDALKEGVKWIHEQSE